MYNETSLIRTPWGPQLTVLYSETSLIRTPWGPQLTVLCSETPIIRTPCTGTTASCPVYGGVLTLEESNVHTSM